MNLGPVPIGAGVLVDPEIVRAADSDGNKMTNQGYGRGAWRNASVDKRRRSAVRLLGPRQTMRPVAPSSRRRYRLHASVTVRDACRSDRGERGGWGALCLRQEVIRRDLSSSSSQFSWSVPPPLVASSGRVITDLKPHAPTRAWRTPTTATATTKRRTKEKG